MVSHRDVEKLLGVHGDGAGVLSLYLSVPKDPDARRGLRARAGELLTLATSARPEAPAVARLTAADRQAVNALLEQHAGEWLGHTAAIFVAGALGLRETIRLPCTLPERAVIADRPHVRPLLVALQRCPTCYLVVVDQRHAWVLRVAGERIDTVSQTSAPGVRSPGFGGWYGLDSYRIHERIHQLAHHHYRDTAALLERAMQPEPGPIVAGGHEQTIPPFLADLPAHLRRQVIGSFTADPHTLTPDRARILALPVIEEWVRERERRLAVEFLREPPAALTALGLNAVLSAVNQHAVDLLVIPIGGVVPGYVCTRCAALGATPDTCPHAGEAVRPTPDLIEEMTVATLRDGGEVEAVWDPPGEIAARLRFPATSATQPPAQPAQQRPAQTRPPSPPAPGKEGKD